MSFNTVERPSAVIATAKFAIGPEMDVFAAVSLYLVSRETSTAADYQLKVRNVQY